MADAIMPQELSRAHESPGWSHLLSIGVLPHNSSAVAKSDCNGSSTSWKNLDLSRKDEVRVAVRVAASED